MIESGASMRPPSIEGGKKVGHAFDAIDTAMASMRPPSIEGGKDAVQGAFPPLRAGFNEAALNRGRKETETEREAPKLRASMRPPSIEGGKSMDAKTASKPAAKLQ